jgi:hypothetical protein
MFFIKKKLIMNIMLCEKFKSDRDVTLYFFLLNWLMVRNYTLKNE